MYLVKAGKLWLAASVVAFAAGVLTFLTEWTVTNGTGWKGGLGRVASAGADLLPIAGAGAGLAAVAYLAAGWAAKAKPVQSGRSAGRLHRWPPSLLLFVAAGYLLFDLAMFLGSRW
jgi:hypothetical protein